MPYTQIEVVQQDPVSPNGTSEITFLLTGGGLPPKRVTRVFTEDVPNAELRRWAYSLGQVREGVEVLLARIPVGSTFPLTAPTPPVPTAEEVWRDKVARYLAAKELALTNVTAIANRDALFADINATYLPAYL